MVRRDLSNSSIVIVPSHYVAVQPHGQMSLPCSTTLDVRHFVFEFCETGPDRPHGHQA